MFTADRVEITVMVENWVDMLLADMHPGSGDPHCVTRNSLIEHFDPKRVPPQAENGLSLLVKAWRGRRSVSVLFDVGLTGSVLEHNFAALGVDPTELDHVVISHGHPDHYGGIEHALRLVGRSIPVLTHPDAFLPRYAVMGDGRTAGFYNAAFHEQSVEAAGGRLVLTREPLELGWGVRTTGEIPRTVEFEGPRPPATPGGPGLYQVDGKGAFVLDEVWDEQGLVIDVAGEGLIILTGCAHAGVINTVAQAQAMHPGRPVRAVLGGLHLGFPTTPESNVDKTVVALAEHEVQLVMPMHCSGLRAHTAFSTALPQSYVQPAVGTTLVFGHDS